MNDIKTPPAKTTVSQPPRSAFGGPVGWLRSEIDRLFDDFAFPSRSMFAFNDRPTPSIPAIDFTSNDKGYTLTAELPGLTEKNVEISVADGVLSLSGEKKEEQERKEEGCLVSERRYGSFRRSMPLPEDVDASNIAARFKDGVLTVTLPRDEKSAQRARKIAIEHI